MSWRNNNSKFLGLLPEIAQKYSAPNVSQSDLRKSAMLLRKIFKGEKIKVGLFDDNFSLTERFSLLILGVLYTFRNDRFHGDMHPPFKSSLATLQTYAHAHFCFLATHHVFIQSLEEARWASANYNETALTLARNIDDFEQLYGKHLAKSKRQPTKRAPDAGESAAISGSFLRLIIFPVGRLRRPRPSAGNANR
jgi:hypothetical protein